MEASWRSQLYLVLIFVTSALAFNTYLTQEFLGLNEFLAEGIPLIVGFIFIIFSMRKSVKLNLTLFVYLIYIIYLMLVTLYYIVLENHNFIKLLFLYQYIPFIIIISNLKDIKQSLLIKSVSQESYKIICIFASISSVIGILQFFNLIDIVPIDINRARGLSRSTLNYSSLLFLAFICASQINKDKLKILFMILIYIGLLASQGRGGIFAATLYYLILNVTNLKKIFLGSLVITIIFVAIYFLDDTYIAYYPNVLILRDRLLNGLSMENDLGNSLRVITYSRILEEFNFFGIGVGSTGPAADRFQPGTGYESFTLALVAQGGIVGILVYAIIGTNECINSKHINRATVALILSYFFMMSTQQTFETPTVNILAWIIIILFTSNNYRNFKYAK